MRIARNCPFCVLILALACAPAVYAQAKRQLPVQVVNVAANEKGVPVAKARVELVRDSTGAHISGGAAATDAAGLVVLNVDVAFQTALDVRVEITSAGDLVLYRPEEGDVDVRQRNLTLKLLPKGSKALMDPPNLEALISRLSKASSSPSQRSSGQAQAKPDLTASLSEWAQRNGFRLDQVEEQLRQWSDKILQNPASATTRQRALAEYASKNFLRAAELFGVAADTDEQELERDQKRIKEAEDRARATLRRVLDNKISQAESFSAAAHYTEARIAIEEGYKKVDQGRYREFWVDMLHRLAGASEDEGRLGEAMKSASALDLAVLYNRQLLHELSGPSDRTARARTQNNLAIALLLQGERTSGPEAARLLAEAVDAYRAALEFYRKTDLPQNWATTQNNLGNALWDQGERSSGAEASKLLAQAVDAYRAALEVYTKADLPKDWAMTQNNLGNALRYQGERSGGAEGAKLLKQAVDAYRAALEVYTKADLPQNWAMTQNNLGVTLQSQGERSSGAEGAKLLGQAVDANRAALEVQTKADLPQDWARTQHNLGMALRDQGERSSGAEGAKLLEQAVDACRSALEVHTKADLPQNWAATQTNLGATLQDQGERSSGAEGAKLLEQAVDAYRSALEVYTKADLPQNWAATQHNLGAALQDQGERSGGAEGAKLLAQAVDNYRAALEVRTKADLPQDWAMTQTNLAQAFALQGDWAGAATAAEHVLELYPEDATHLHLAGSVYHDRLFEFAKAFEFNQRLLNVDNSSGARVGFAEKHLTTARFSECLTRWSELKDSEIDQEYFNVRDSLRFACEFGAGEADAASGSAGALLKAAQSLQKTSWNFRGTKHFVASHPAFSAAKTAWVKLFESLENGDGPGLAEAVRTIQATL